MNKDYVLDLSAGEELNNLVTHEIMGYENNWSESISAAWEVAEKAESYKLSKLPDGDTRIKYGGQYQFFFNTNKYCGYGDTAPLAICRAALLSLISEETP